MVLTTTESNHGTLLIVGDPKPQHQIVTPRTMLGADCFASLRQVLTHLLRRQRPARVVLDCLGGRNDLLAQPAFHGTIPRERSQAIKEVNTKDNEFRVVCGRQRTADWPDLGDNGSPRWRAMGW